jgi:hypothetical protein
MRSRRKRRKAVTTATPMVLMAMRLPQALLKRVEDHAERLRRATPGANLTRADAVRVLLTAALDVEEGKHGC